MQVPNGTGPGVQSVLCWLAGPVAMFYGNHLNEVIHPLLSCYFIYLPQFIDVWSILLPFVRNPYFVSKIRLYSFNIGFLYKKKNKCFVFAIKYWHLYRAMCLLSVSIYTQDFYVLFHKYSKLARLWRLYFAAYTKCQGLLLVWMFYSEGDATFKQAFRTGIRLGTLEIVIEEVLWSIRVSYKTIWSSPLTNVKWHSVAWPYTVTTPHWPNVVPNSTFTEFREVSIEHLICDGCGRPSGDAYSIIIIWYHNCFSFSMLRLDKDHMSVLVNTVKSDLNILYLNNQT